MARTIPPAFSRAGDARGQRPPRHAMQWGASAPYSGGDRYKKPLFSSQCKVGPFGADGISSLTFDVSGAEWRKPHETRTSTQHPGRDGRSSGPHGLHGRM